MSGITRVQCNVFQSKNLTEHEYRYALERVKRVMTCLATPGSVALRASVTGRRPRGCAGVVARVVQGRASTVQASIVQANIVRSSIVRSGIVRSGIVRSGIVRSGIVRAERRAKAALPCGRAARTGLGACFEITGTKSRLGAGGGGRV
jgi:hypothetical protein